MGRAINGDIDGKFWFAVQPSDAADRFGVTGRTPDYLVYYYDEEDLDGVVKELKNIEDTLGDKLEKFDNFFKENTTYNDQMLIDLGFNKETLKQDLSDYADYGLGVKIRDCIKEQGSCFFEAEL